MGKYCVAYCSGHVELTNCVNGINEVGASIVSVTSEQINGRTYYTVIYQTANKKGAKKGGVNRGE